MSNYYIGNIVCTNELSHHGIIGQRWGVRRFQNPDGSLTPEGRIRYGRSGDNEIKYPDKLIRGSTNNPNTWNDAVYRCFDNTRTKARIKSVIDSDKPYPKAIKKLSEAFKKTNDKLNQLGNKYLAKMEKENGKEWDGDGTEAHWEMEDRYPEYNQCSSQYDKYQRELVESIKKSVNNGDFDDVFRDMKNLMYRSDVPEYKWTEVIDGRCGAIGYYLASTYNFDFFPEFFSESRELKNGSIGKKIKDNYI